MKKLLLLMSLFLSLSCGARTVKLNSENHAFLKTQVSSYSVQEIIAKLRELDASLPKGEPLYLVLKTPGGSVLAGRDLINATKQLSRPVTTITIESASMGFQIAQELGERLIVDYGLTMMHQISAGCQGTLSEINNCVKIVTFLFDYANKKAAARIGLSVKDYVDRINIEWFEMGIGAVKAKLMDALVSIKCDKDLIDSGNCPY